MGKRLDEIESLLKSEAAAYDVAVSFVEDREWRGAVAASLSAWTMLGKAEMVAAALADEWRKRGIAAEVAVRREQITSLLVRAMGES
jgi:hypothetical protein